MKKWLLGKSLEELKEISEDLSLPSFTAKQLTEWIYKKKASDILQMTNLSKHAREVLSADYQVGCFASVDKQISSDGTKKYLFPTIGGNTIESVMIPEEDRTTLCVSSQCGCKMGCKFCMTARLGFKGHLTAGEIISQFINIDECDRLTNAVFMGMGEPLDNLDSVLKSIEILTAEWGFAWSPKRITLSTIGIYPALKEYLEKSKCHLAISLHNPIDEERNELILMQKAYPIAETINLVKSYDFSGQRRVSFEYIMFNGWNDSKRHADALIRMLKGIECRVNLIRFHRIPDFPMVSTPDAKIELFKTRLNNAGLLTTVRASRGEDILAACGMLSGNNNLKR
ncbi:MAG: 23S rRNA (adenine(2503)-C(2))-methyltransferase RlmN [Bacteroidales bacterium]